jgi:pectinesterase
MKKILTACLLLTIVSVAYAKKYDIVVAQDGSGNFTTVQAAINSVRAVMAERKTIFIKKGTYREKVVVSTDVINVTLIGEDRDSTIITWADHANIIPPGAEKKMGTFKTYTLLVQGHGFHAVNLTIENNAPQLGQAVALHVEGDKAIFVNCRILGNQDTIYVGSQTSRQYYKNCYIDGTTDFIFGSGTAYFDKCEIHSKKNSYITAPSTPQDNPYGLVFNRCKLTADSTITKVYLGRPWRPYGETVYVKCELGKHILPAGWDNWRNPENEKTARFAEVGNTGPGADLSGRVAWSQQVCGCKANYYTPKEILKGCDKWNPEKDMADTKN